MIGVDVRLRCVEAHAIIYLHLHAGPARSSDALLRPAVCTVHVLVFVINGCVAIGWCVTEGQVHVLVKQSSSCCWVGAVSVHKRLACVLWQGQPARGTVRAYCMV